MTDSPAAKTPYEVLGVTPGASESELKRAYRRALREAHPDAGGSAARFHAVQAAWDRIGEAASRAAYDRMRPAAPQPATPAPRGTAKPDGELRARSHGHPGGWARENFLTHMREWSGRGVDLDDPYEPALVHSAPRGIRRLLAEAIAEESTARAVSSLGIGYTIWNDVATSSPARGDTKIDHIVLGPAGLFAIRSQDWGSEVRVRRGELAGEGVAEGERPFRELSRASRSLGKSLGVKFTAVLIVVPDDDLAEAIEPGNRDGSLAVLRLSTLPRVLRDGVSGGVRLSVDAVFDVRTRLQRGIRFV
ncbi:MAG: DnaJ domain-containing protein [Cryobacterium sp.]|nr:DnaJ domain-containing protein [Cryobacterium sp.]